MAGQWIKLVSRARVGDVTIAFTNAIAESFAADRSTQTQQSLKQRFNICAKIFENLCGDLNWSVDRAIDHIPRYLRFELDRQPYDPKSDSERVLWTPNMLGDPLT